MLVIVKAVLLLVLEIIIEYLFGTLLIKLLLKREIHPVANVLVGFMGFQAVFQVLSLAVTFATGVLHHLSIVWFVVSVVITIAAIIICKKNVAEHIHQAIRVCKKHKVVCGVTLAVIIAFCYYVSINGEINEDARYYIGLMTTSVGTDSLFRYNVYNGYEGEAMYLRRMLATFEIHSAVLSQISGIHPLVLARVFRACQNVILTSIAVFVCSEELLWKREKQCLEKALVTVIVFWLLQLVFADTIYTPAAFTLYRAYEAKAYTSNLLVLLGLYLCMKTITDKRNRICLLLVIFLWGSMAISTSAMIVALAECTILLIALWLNEMLRKKQEMPNAK